VQDTRKGAAPFDKNGLEASCLKPLIKPGRLVGGIRRKFMRRRHRQKTRGGETSPSAQRPNVRPGEIASGTDIEL
jgi:hypothetical protein